MATISKTGIVDGQVLYADHVTRIIDALDGTANTTTIIATGSFNGSLVGSLTGSATSASFASTASYFAGSVTSASYAVTSSFSSNSTFAINSSFATTASFITLARSASYVANAQTASFVITAQTASYVVTAQTASFVALARTASFITGSNVFGPFGSNSVISSSNSLSSSFALTASYALNGGGSTFPFTGNAQITGSLLTTGSTTLTGPVIVDTAGGLFEVTTDNGGYGQGYAFVSPAQWGIASPVGQVGVNNTTKRLFIENSYQAIYLDPNNSISSLSAGASTSASLKVFSPNVRFTGIASAPSSSVQITGSLLISGSISGSVGVINQLTASYAMAAQTASFVTTAQTASFVTTAQTASFVTLAQTSSLALRASGSLTGSLLGTAATASYIVTAQTASFVTLSQTASFITTAQTASYVTSSKVFGPNGANSILSASYAVSASWAPSAAGGTVWYTTAVTTGYAVPSGLDVGVYFSGGAGGAGIRFDLPTTPTVGSRVEIVMGPSATALTTVNTTAPATIQIGTSTTAAGGSVTNGGANGAVWRFVCVSASRWALTSYTDQSIHFGYGLTINAT